MHLPSDADISGRDLGKEELELLGQVIESGALNRVHGTQVKLLEREFAARMDVKHARAVNSGSAAVQCAVAAIDPEPGDEIITTPVTDMGAVAGILFQGAVPVFADVEPMTLNVTPESVAARVTSRTRAIIVTHMFGQPCDVDGIRAIANGIPIIEDCAHAYLARLNGKLAGTIGDLATFSLQQGQHMTAGEGGIVITSDPRYAQRIELFTEQGWGGKAGQEDYEFLAPNIRMTEVQGAVARAQLCKLEGCVARRQRAAARFTERLIDEDGLLLPLAEPGRTHVYWKYPVVVDPDVIPGGSAALSARLRMLDICSEGRYVRKPVFECRAIAGKRTFGNSGYPFSLRPDIEYHKEEYPGTYRGLERVMLLPWNEFYTDKHVDYIAFQVHCAVGKLTSIDQARLKASQVMGYGSLWSGLESAAG